MKTLTKLIPVFALMIPAAATADSLPKQVESMQCLIGTWKATGTVAMGKDTAKVTATWTCKSTSAKFGVLCTLDLAGIPGVPHYAETDLFGYEPNSNTAHWFSVTNAGETHDHVAPMPDGDSAEFVYTGTQEGKPFKEVVKLTFIDKKNITVRAETFVAGASTSVFDIKAKK